MSSRFKGLGSISADATPPPFTPAAPTIPPAPQASALQPAPACDPRFVVPHLERFMVPLRAYRSRLEQLYVSFPAVSRFLVHDGKGVRGGALELGLQKQWDAVSSMEKQIDRLVLRSAPDLEFGKAVTALEARWQNLFNAMNESLPGSQGSLI